MDFSDVFNFSDYDRLIPLVANSLWAGVLLALVGGLIGVFCSEPRAVLRGPWNF